jgi:hypothetical protein
MTVQTACRRCGKPIEADRARILAGGWQYCDRCRPKPPNGAKRSVKHGMVR